MVSGLNFQGGEIKNKEVVGSKDSHHYSLLYKISNVCLLLNAHSGDRLIDPQTPVISTPTLDSQLNKYNFNFLVLPSKIKQKNFTGIFFSYSIPDDEER